MNDENFAERATGVAPPRSFILDASVLEMAETQRIVREDVRQNRIEYEFPEGLNKADLFDECRALNRLDDFDTMYDLTMQMLAGKPVIINIKNYDGSKSELCSFQVTDAYQDLRGVGAINEYPVVVVWLTEFMAAKLLKKSPVPGGSTPPQSQTPDTERGKDAVVKAK
jgi:hypothetical protein